MPATEFPAPQPPGGTRSGAPTWYSGPIENPESDWMSRILQRFLIVRVGLLVTSVLPAAGPASAGGRAVVTPFGGATPLEDTAVVSLGAAAARSVTLTPRQLLPILQSGADHIVVRQCADGGFGWPHDDCTATYHDITAPILLGVLHAHARTDDPSHLAAAGETGIALTVLLQAAAGLVVLRRTLG